VLGAAALALAAGLLALLLAGGGRGGPRVPGSFADRNPRHEAALESHEAKFELRPGDEANPQSPASPAAEQVAERAYPRGYVDDRLAHRAEHAFQSKPAPDNLDRSSFDSARAFQLADATGPWSSLGPTTPNVPGQNSQFIDPNTQTGPSTQESGRVTALAIDPNCSAGDCRMWVAAAGGGIWRTSDALASHVQWVAPSAGLPTNAFGSLYFDPNAGANGTIYAGSGEPNGSSDSEAGLGLFKSTDSGATWSLVVGSSAVATNRSIGAIAVDPSDANTIYIGTDVARHGSSAVNGGRRTPPNAPTLGVYRSTDGGQTFALEQDLSNRTPPSANAPAGGQDWFQGGVNKLELDPNDHNMLYAGVFGYGVWRADQSSPSPGWGQVFATMNPADTTGDRTEFDLVNDAGTTSAYVGDASDEWATDTNADGSPKTSTPLPQAWRNPDVSAITADPGGNLDNAAAGWVQMSSQVSGDRGFGVYGYCQNGQCGYDSFVAHPPGAAPGTVWYGGSMNYGELPAYASDPPRSNGRAVVRSTNADASSPQTNTNWRDMTAVLSNPNQAWGVQSGIHPDLHAIAFADNGNTAFIGSDGGVVRLDLSSTRDQSPSCAARTYEYSPPVAAPLNSSDLQLCQMLLGAVPNSITPLNDGLNDLQFQSLSYNPANASGSLLGGTQDNGTWLYNGAQPAAGQWFESVGGDGGQSGFDAADPSVVYHNYYQASPEVNFNGGDPSDWYGIYDSLPGPDSEQQSFYVPFLADPKVGGRAFTGLQHIYRTDDHGGTQAFLQANGCSSLAPDPNRTLPCGDWQQVSTDLTGTAGGRSGGYIANIARTPSDTGTMWASTSAGRLWVTKNADATPGALQWYRVDKASTPGRFISGISIDSNDPSHAFVSYNGYSAYTPTTPGHVFEVTYSPSTHSAVVSDRSYNLGDQPVTGIAYDGGTGDLYAATDFGVLRLPAGSTQWIDAAPNMPNVAVYGLALAENDRLLLAATHGRGAYSLTLPPARPTPTPGPTPTPTPAKNNPAAMLGKITAGRTGKPTVIRGAATDPGGIGSVLLGWGDGTRVRPKLGADGSFVLRHRYRRAKRFTITLTVTGTDGTPAQATRRVRVRSSGPRGGA